MSSLAAVFLAGTPLFVQAGMYRCTEGGKVTYSDQPCGASTEAVTVKPASGNYNRAEARRVEAQDARDFSIRSEIGAMQNARAAERAARSASAPREDECARMKRQHADAKYWAGEFIHPDNVNREKEKAKKLASQSFFSGCGSKGVSVFDE